MWWADFMSSSYLRRETIRASSFFFSPPPPSLRSNLYPRPARGGLSKPAEAQSLPALSPLRSDGALGNCSNAGTSGA